MRIHRNNPIRLFAFLLLFICGGTTLSAQKASPDTDLLKRFERSIAEGKLSEVETPLFEYVRENPASAGGFAIFAKLRFKQGRFDEARSLLRKALSLDPNFTTAKMDLAAVQSELGEVDEARATLLGISVRDIKDNSVRLRLAQSLQDVGECAKALDVISP